MHGTALFDNDDRDHDMTAESMKEIVIPQEEATFWMDGQGNWCNRNGRFQHKKIIAYFHRSIGRDARGYFVSQINGDVREKVYFRYEDTPLFVWGIIQAESIVLVLNTGRRIALDPSALYIHQDALYMQDGGERIKFSEASMLKLSRYIEHEGDRSIFSYQGQRIFLPIEGDARPLAASGRTASSSREAAPGKRNKKGEIP